MKKRTTLLRAFAFLFVLSVLVTGGCQKDAAEPETGEIAVYSFTTEPIPGQYIVILNNEEFQFKPLNKNLNYAQQVTVLKEDIAAQFESAVIDQLQVKEAYAFAVTGFAAVLSDEEVAKLRADKRVKSIEQDQLFTLAKPDKPGNGGGGNENPPPQVTPWGITRVGGGVDGTGKTAWIIDSGIDLNHPDLNVDVARSVSFLTGSPSNYSPDDQNGHGTHVAGTVGALDNSIGVVGVAPNTAVVAVRVLDKRGSGTISGVIAGVDYVAANGASGDVANMSLGGGVSTSLDNAVKSAAATGIKFSLAAGNESDDANNHSPARANGTNIYTVSAMNSSDAWAYFSNYGSAVDYCAPGVSVHSTWKDGGYNTISGTSMAAPHVAGLLVGGNITTDGYVSGDPDGNPDPIAHR